MDNERRAHKRKLQDGVDSLNKKPKPSDTTSRSASTQKSPDQTNIPNLTAAFSITRWESALIPTELPPLPAIFDPTLEAGAFIHQGCTTDATLDLSYERLEWVGDAYLYLTSTLLISQTFPALLPGRCAQLRERVVKNITLAGYAQQYNFQARAKLPVVKDGDRTKILGDIFEAYIAAIILSDPINGVSRCTEWLKALMGMTLRKEIIEQEKSGIQFDSPLWRLRPQDKPVQLTSSREQKDAVMNAKDRLRIAIVSKGIQLSYKDAAPVRKDPESKLAVFTVGVYLDGWGEKNRQLGVGSAYGKKEAGAKAAEMALKNEELINSYREKKREADTRLGLERKALEEAESSKS